MTEKSFNHSFQHSRFRIITRLNPGYGITLPVQASARQQKNMRHYVKSPGLFRMSLLCREITIGAIHSLLMRIRYSSFGNLQKILPSPANMFPSAQQARDKMLDFLKEPEEPPEHFFSLVDAGMHGLIRVAALYAAGSLRLFDYLEKGPGSLRELSLATGIDEERLFPLLGVLTRSGISAQSASIDDVAEVLGSDDTLASPSAGCS